MECIWSDPSQHPQCPHGPTLLFGTYNNGKLEKIYACAACRDRKLCKFYLKEGEKLTKQQTLKWEQERKQYISRYNHRLLYLKYNEIMSLPSDKRGYCHTCEKLITKNERANNHKNHDVKKSMTDYEMKHPTEILKPLENNKQEAQYFFSKKSTEDIANMLVKLGAKQILCIGTPRIHEYFVENYEDEIASLLLDFDGRFHNFFGPLSYCWYNLLNNHFFNEGALHVFKDFLTQNEGKDTYLVCDPPFGSRTEPMSWTIKRISDLYKKWNNIENEDDCLKIIFISPYFMESIMKKKGNPPGVSGGLKNLKMTDYKVTYENHPSFIMKPEFTNKLHSPIRIFTNIPLNTLELPKSDGYKYCKKCQKWVSKENKHCKICKECTSKNGSTYKHCEICGRCVKSSWKHCEICKRCIVVKHTCGQKPKIIGRCNKCNELGHTEKECKNNQNNNDNETKTKKMKKRKSDNVEKTVKNVKRRKIDDSNEPTQKGGKKLTTQGDTVSEKKLIKKFRSQKKAEKLKVKIVKKSQQLEIRKILKMRKKIKSGVKTAKRKRKIQSI